MDYHSLARKDLQALCKLNKIPANKTNVAMAEALSSLRIVKGIEKLCESTRPVAPVKSVQRVYNTRLSARLLKKELMEESKKKECVEAVEIGTHCDGEPDNDFGEVSEDHNLLDTVTEVLADEGCVEVEISSLENELQSESLKRGNGKNLDAQVTDSIGVKGVVLNEKVELLPMDSEKGVVDTPIHKTKAVTLILSPQKKVFDNVGGDLFLSETEQETIYHNWKNDKELDEKDTAATFLKFEVPLDKVEGIQVVTLKPIGEMLSHDNKAAIDRPHHKMRDDVGVDSCLSETDTVTEVLADEVKLLQMDSEKGIVNTPIHETKAVSLLLSPEKKASDDFGVDFSFMETKLLTESSKRGIDKNLDTEVIGSSNMTGEILSHDVVVEVSAEVLAHQGSDDVEVHFSFSESDENVDAADICSTDSKESESLKEQLQMESSEKVNYDGCVHDLMIQQKSEKIVFECWASDANNFVDGENLDISVKIQQNISCHAEYGGVYDNVKELTTQEVSSKAVASYPNMNLESYGRTENPIHNISGDDTPADIVNFQHNVYSKQSDSKGKPVCEILSDNSAMEITNQLEMTGSIEATDDFSGGVAFVDESGDDDKDRLAVDPKRISKTELDFSEYAICSKHQDRKRESMASQLLGGSCTKEPVDQSETQGSFDLSVGSNKVTSNHQYVSGKSLTKESRLHVASDVSYCCFGIKKMSFDESQQASEVMSPYIAICSKQQDKKRESIVSQLLGSSYIEEPADQSETPDSTVGFSSNVASNH